MSSYDLRFVAFKETCDAAAAVSINRNLAFLSYDVLLHGFSFSIEVQDFILVKNEPTVKKKEQKSPRNQPEFRGLKLVK